MKISTRQDIRNLFDVYEGALEVNSPRQLETVLDEMLAAVQGILIFNLEEGVDRDFEIRKRYRLTIKHIDHARKALMQRRVK